MNLDGLNSDFLQYLIAKGYQPGDRVPALNELRDEIGVSVGKLREQLEVARTLGLVEVRPKTGIRVEPYDFLPAVSTSLLFALAQDPGLFESFGALRNHLESAFWLEAVGLLTDQDKRDLQDLMRTAWAKLSGPNIQIPHAEHRELHLTVFRRLDNPFVRGILEAYWEAYEAVELNLYSDYEYLREVWSYHQRIVDSIVEGRPQDGQALLIEHANLLRHRLRPEPQPTTEPVMP